MLQIADLAGATVIQHFRCRPVVGDDAARYEYESGDELDKLSKALAEAARKFPYDKVVYEVHLAGGRTCFIQFTDWVATFGTKTLDMNF